MDILVTRGLPSFELCIFGAIIILLICQLLNVLKNIFFHPLSHIPGPWVFASGRLPYIYYSVTGQLVKTLDRLHQRYGPIVRTAVNEVSFIEPAAWKHIHVQKDAHGHVFPKNYDLFPETRNQFTESVFLASDSDHERMRRSLNPAFSERQLRESEPFMQLHIDELIESLDRELETHTAHGRGGTVDLDQRFSWTAFDIISEFTIGRSFACLSKPDHRPWLKQLSTTWKFIAVLSSVKHLPGLFKIFSMLIPTSLLQKRVDQLFFLYRNAQMQRKAPQTHSTVMSSALKCVDGEKGGLSEGELMSNASFLIAAGTDTIATVLPALVFLLCRNPQAMAVLRQAVRTRFQSEAQITSQNASTLHFLTACIQETLRIYPPVPEGLPRLVPAGGDVICAKFIPEGAYVQVSAFAASMSTDNFVEPRRFLPQRWLLDNATDKSKFTNDKKLASRPFSAGARNCIGQNFAMTEIRLVMARLLWRFDMSLASDGDENWLDQKCFLLWQRRPLKIRLERVVRGEVAVSEKAE